MQCANVLDVLAFLPARTVLAALGASREHWRWQKSIGANEFLRALVTRTLKTLEDRTQTCKQLEDIVSKQNAEIKELRNREAQLEGRYEATVRWKNRQLEDEKRVRVETVKSQKEKMEQMEQMMEQMRRRVAQTEIGEAGR